MALSTLAEIRSAALGLRTDMLSRFAAEMLPLAEQRIFYGDGPLNPLRVLPMEETQDLEFTDGAAALPAGYLDKRALYWEAEPESLGYEPPSTFYPSLRRRQGAARPLAYTIEGQTVKIAPALTGTAKLLFYKRPAAMTEDGHTNAILAAWPGVYLYSLQMELFRLLRNDGELAKVRQWYADAIEAANRQTLVARSLGAPLRKRVGFGV